MHSCKENLSFQDAFLTDISVLIFPRELNDLINKEARDLLATVQIQESKHFQQHFSSRCHSACRPVKDTHRCTNCSEWLNWRGKICSLLLCARCLEFWIPHCCYITHNLFQSDKHLQVHQTISRSPRLILWLHMMDDDWSEIQNSELMFLSPLDFWKRFNSFVQRFKLCPTEKEGLTSVHCPFVCTMSMTQGSDLFSVSRSSRALQDTRNSTLVTQVAGPLRLVAGEVASWMSFILAQGKRSCQPAKRARCEAVGVAPGGWRIVEASRGTSAKMWHAHGKQASLTKRTESPVEFLRTKPTPSSH